MNKTIIVGMLALMLILGLGGSAWAETVSGRVTNELSGEGVANVHVVVSAPLTLGVVASFLQ